MLVLKGWIVKSHTSWIGERSAGLEGVDCEIPHQLDRETKHWTPRGDPTSVGEGNKALGRSHISWRGERSTGPRRGWIMRFHISWRWKRSVGVWRGWIVRSHISWRGELTILYKGARGARDRRGWIVRSQIGLREERNILTRMWKPLSSIILRGKSKKDNNAGTKSNLNLGHKPK